MARASKAAVGVKGAKTTKSRAKAPVQPKPAPQGLDFHIARHSHELPKGDGVMRVEPGDYVVTTAEGVAVLPPERFAEAYPEHAG